MLLKMSKPRLEHAGDFISCCQYNPKIAKTTLPICSGLYLGNKLY